jgi:hypothetical protein
LLDEMSLGPNGMRRISAAADEHKERRLTASSTDVLPRRATRRYLPA